MKLKLFIIAFVAAALAAGSISYWLISVKAELTKVTYQRLKKDFSITRGLVVPVEQIEEVQLLISTELEKIAIRHTPSLVSWVATRRATQDLPGGSLLLYQYFTDDLNTGLAARIDPAKRAISIPVAAQTSVTNMVEPESVVDLIAAFEDRGGSGEVRAQSILQGIRVLAVGTTQSRSQYPNVIERGYSTVTVEVTPDQANILVLVLSRAKGGLTLALRNPKTTATEAAREVSSSELRR